MIMGNASAKLIFHFQNFHLIDKILPFFLKVLKFPMYYKKTLKAHRDNILIFKLFNIYVPSYTILYNHIFYIYERSYIN